MPHRLRLESVVLPAVLLDPDGRERAAVLSAGWCDRGSTAADAGLRRAWRALSE